MCFACRQPLTLQFRTDARRGTRRTVYIIIKRFKSQSAFLPVPIAFVASIRFVALESQDPAQAHGKPFTTSKFRDNLLLSSYKCSAANPTTFRAKSVYNTFEYVTRAPWVWLEVGIRRRSVVSSRNFLLQKVAGTVGRIIDSWHSLGFPVDPRFFQNLGRGVFPKSETILAANLGIKLWSELTKELFGKRGG